MGPQAIVENIWQKGLNNRRLETATVGGWLPEAMVAEGAVFVCV